MPPPRFWVSLVWSFVLRVRDVARVAALPLGVTSVVGLVLVPIPWEEDRASAARAAKVRRNAWLLAGFAVLVYVGYMLWFVIRGGV